MKSKNTQEILNLLEETNKRLEEMLNKKSEYNKKTSSASKNNFSETNHKK